MKKIDARKLPKEVQQHNRDQAIRLFQQGKTRKEISAIVGVHCGGLWLDPVLATRR